DLASLTKPLATALLAVRLQSAGRLRLEDRVDRHLPEWRPAEDGPPLTLLDLLTHRSGLPAWLPLYARAEDVTGRIGFVAGTAPAHPPLLGVTYSCPNYLLAGFAIERVAGAPLDRLFETLGTGPLGIEDLGYRPHPGLRDRIAPTETGNAHERALAGPLAAGYNGWRRDLIWGEVHDHNAWSLGGVAGNAGLFGTARAVWSLARVFLRGGPGLLGDEERALFGHDFTPGLNQARAVGFQLAATPGCSAGPALSPRSFGHTGFTGTSLWIDPDAERIAVLLTNRVHPVHRERDLHPLRREFNALARAL
ncbi:MAG TPA: serine hydrolase domain-containing protein, partial [Candidatus Polarisedimenticolia bacterium]|nr:serine hydrolase domain-containing protein [Candidatus Polarisedimenticolia bacterium]